MTKEKNQEPQNSAPTSTFRKVVYTTASAYREAAYSTAKMTGGIVAAYYTLIGLIIGIQYGGGVDVLPEGIDELVSNNMSVANLPEGQCYYVSENTAKSFDFLEYPTGYISGSARLFTPFMDSQRLTHELGSTPMLKTAECDALKDDIKLSVTEARQLSAQWKQTFLDSPELSEALSNMKSGEGWFEIDTVNKNPAP